MAEEQMGPVETELAQDLRFRLAGIAGVPEVILEALDQQDVGVIENHTPSAEAVTLIQWEILHFVREAVLRLAREVDELRAAGAEGDDLG